MAGEQEKKEPRGLEIAMWGHPRFARLFVQAPEDFNERAWDLGDVLELKVIGYETLGTIEGIRVL